MKVTIVGQNKNAITPVLKSLGFIVTETRPQFVISYGGDGTLMRAEAQYPGIPKIALRDSLVCKKCSTMPNEEVMRKVMDRDYDIEELMKIEMRVQGEKMIGLNDVTIHNSDPRKGIRYKIHVNGRQLGNEVIGDGVVIATPFGSSAYYRSITDSYFEVGIGIAFNNSTEQADHIVVKEDSIIDIEITRGPALAFTDSNKKMVKLGTGMTVRVAKAKETAKIVTPRA